LASLSTGSPPRPGGSNRSFQDLDLYWRSPESGSVWSQIKAVGIDDLASLSTGSTPRPGPLASEYGTLRKHPDMFYGEEIRGFYLNAKARTRGFYLNAKARTP